MLQKTYHITDFTGGQLEGMLSEVAGLPEYGRAAQVLLIAFEMNWDAGEILRKVRAVRQALPKVEIAGVTHYEQIFQGEIPGNHTMFTFLFFDSPAFTAFRLPMEGRTDGQLAEELKARLQSLSDLKGVMTWFAQDSRNVDRLLKLANLGDVPVFGASAGTSDLHSDGSVNYVFDGDGVYRDALLAVAFHGADLRVEASYNFGWQPVGKTMTVTAMEGDFLVTQIDHRPAAEIYERYLGLDYRQNQIAIDNICEFPLMVERAGLPLVRIPTEWKPDGTLVFHAALKVGDRLRFCYGLPQQIFEQVCADGDRFRQFVPQGMLLILCLNRAIFLKERERLEIQSYRKLAPELVFVHGSSEIYFRNGAGGEMHSSLIAVGIREGAPEAALPLPEGECPLEVRGDVLVPLELRLMSFMRAVTSDLEQTTRELTHLQHNLEDEVERKSRENESLSLHVVMTLADAIDAKDTYTHGHSGRVAKYAREIARRAGRSSYEQEAIFVMGLLHDVGKIGVPDAVINKPGKLTDEEFAMIKAHPVMGARILGNIREMPGLATGARWHHERIDGRGYPDGLTGDKIPYEARIIGVADAYDAMTSNRSYRGLMPQAKVRQQIENGRGTQFDPVYADIMIEMIDEDKDYQMREL